MFWPYVKQHIPATRLFFCDPPGSSDPKHIMNYEPGRIQDYFIYCHDQEPVYSDIHSQMFESVHNRNIDLNCNIGPIHSAMVVSELESDQVDAVCRKYSWTPYYYFFHGWAALDWFRGYHRTSLVIPISKRKTIHSFISTNRIIGGRRDHRVLLMYHLLKHRVSNALISCPKVCPYENIDIGTIAQSYNSVYPDIVDTLSHAGLPWNMPNETGHPMHSYKLSLFDENYKSLVQVVTETSFFGRKWHLTEKTFKPICMQMPFVLVSNAGSLEYIKRYGFKTFDTVWDESYDQEHDDFRRLEKIAQLLAYFDAASTQERLHIQQACQSIVEYNFQHFYGGGFEKILWNEFSNMLHAIKVNCS
jgi:hypothetical protein